MLKDLLKQIEKEYGQNVVALNKSQPPYTKVKRGYGYEGVLLWDSVGDRVQCHLCGKWMKQISGLHLHQSHNEMSASDYKESFGLNKGQSLTTESRSRQLAERTLSELKRNPKFSERMKRIGKRNFTKAARTRKRGEGGRYQRKNTQNTCDAQLSYRFNLLKKELGRIPTQKECPFFSTLVRRYGSWNNALKFLAGKINKEVKVWDKKKIIKALREYKSTYGNIPTAKELRVKNFYLNPEACYRHFGRAGFSKALKKAFN